MFESHNPNGGMQELQIKKKDCSSHLSGEIEK
jgi:hypothetical protein